MAASSTFIKRNSGSVTLSILSAGEGAAWTAIAITASEYTQRRLPVQRKKKTSGKRYDQGENGQRVDPGFNNQGS